MMTSSKPTLLQSQVLQAALMTHRDIQWVSSILDRPLPLPQAALVWVLCSGRERSYHCQSYHWGGDVWRSMAPWGTGATVVITRGLATYDDSLLSSIVATAHDIGARVELLPFLDHRGGDDDGDGYLTPDRPVPTIRVTLHLRADRTGGSIWGRHPATLPTPPPLVPPEES